MTDQEERKHARVHINRQFRSMEHFIKSYAADVSRSGAFIRTDEVLPVGSRIEMKFTIVTTEIETLEGVAEVVRVSHDPSGMGIQFLELTDESGLLVDKLTAYAESQDL